MTSPESRGRISCWMPRPNCHSPRRRPHPSTSDSPYWLQYAWMAAGMPCSLRPHCVVCRPTGRAGGVEAERIAAESRRVVRHGHAVDERHERPAFAVRREVHQVAIDDCGCRWHRPSCAAGCSRCGAPGWRWRRCRRCSRRCCTGPCSTSPPSSRCRGCPRSRRSAASVVVLHAVRGGDAEAGSARTDSCRCRFPRSRSSRDRSEARSWR